MKRPSPSRSSPVMWQEAPISTPPASSYAGGADLRASARPDGDAGIAVASKANLSAADCVVVIGADPSQKQQSLQELMS